MSKRPNFLFIMTDQHRWDWLGCSGHPVVKTPHIDSLANTGTRFTRFHVASPVCMPNRASLMTGRFPTTHGLRTNGCLLPRNAVTFTDALRESGYFTASIGKSHLQPFTKRPPASHENFEPGPFEEAWRLDGLNYTEEQGDHYDLDERYEFTKPYYGFDHVDMVTEHGVICSGHYLQWLREQTSDWARYRDPQNELAHSYRCPQAFRTPMPEELYSTSYIREQAANWLRGRRSQTEPFFAFVSFPDPHHPFNPPGKYWDMYDPEDFSVQLKHTDHSEPPMPMRACLDAALRGEMPPTPTTSFALMDERAIREAMALSAGMISMIDDAVGVMLDALRESGEYDNTVIVFNSDHGEYLGDFNLMLKGALSMDAINRVPFIWSDPQSREGKVSSALASTVDIAPSVLERAGVGPYFGIQGKSLSACLDGSDELRDSLLIEFNDALPRMGFDKPARVRTLVTDEWRMSMYGDQPWGELYHRNIDPKDTQNLWADSAYSAAKLELSMKLNQHLIDLMDPSPRATRLA